jgi:hypothetical protein
MEIFINILCSTFGFIISKLYDYLKERTYTYDVFISYPMKSLPTRIDKSDFLFNINKIEKLLEDEFNLKPFKSIDDKTEGGKKILEDMKHFAFLKKSRIFLLITFHDQDTNSSTHIELGCAMSSKKQIIILSDLNDAIPHLATNNERIFTDTFVSIDDLSDNVRQIFNSKKKLKRSRLI